MPIILSSSRIFFLLIYFDFSVSFFNSNTTALRIIDLNITFLKYLYSQVLIYYGWVRGVNKGIHVLWSEHT